MKKYTVGFIFNEPMDKVLLIHKLAPEWQIGKINGLGGKVEEGEANITCIVREIKEESGLITEPEDWNLVCIMHSPVFTIDCFAYVYKGDMDDAKSMEAEQIEWFDVNKLPENIIENLSWLIPMSIDKINNTDLRIKTVLVEYN